MNKRKPYYESDKLVSLVEEHKMDYLTASAISCLIEHSKNGDLQSLSEAMWYIERRYSSVEKALPKVVEMRGILKDKLAASALPEGE